MRKRRVAAVAVAAPAAAAAIGALAAKAFRHLAARERAALEQQALDAICDTLGQYLSELTGYINGRISAITLSKLEGEAAYQLLQFRHNPSLSAADGDNPAYRVDFDFQTEGIGYIKARATGEYRTLAYVTGWLSSDDCPVKVHGIRLRGPQLDFWFEGDDDLIRAVTVHFAPNVPGPKAPFYPVHDNEGEGG